ncbi:class I SAM-dependent methyltransferase [Fretibacter rubidus]|uniref:class I SAM-dependent methyltransferase n=1 Tax=Fretibacter rubidus TaxID=570162 RepID=UPI00352A66AF
MSALKDRLIKRIKSEGPMSVAEYMTLCLLDPVDGYYPTRDPLGSDGDFITAPEISQMFGEVIGLWCIQSWIDMGRPPSVQLIELGPGRGIMMADILRTAALDKAFERALSVTLVEASAALEAVQGQTLAATGVPVSWASDISKVPEGPSLIIGNEFLDCLPIRQFIQDDPFAGRGGWVERMVSVDGGALRFVKSPVAISDVVQDALPAAQSDARKDDLLEVCIAARQIVDQIAARLLDYPGRALFIDYGPEVTEFGDTLQALKRHEKVGVFSDPGNTDLTARVDFAALSEAATAAGLDASKAVPQREFLSKLGIEMRAVALIKGKPDAKPKIIRQLHRLMDSDEMGELFKAVCLSSPGLPAALGFKS